MTRDDLRELENQLVIYRGRLVECRPTNDDGTRDYMLSTVDLWLFDENRAVTSDHSSRVARLDHCWIRYQENRRWRDGMLDQLNGLARVGWYRRSDGSIDLGLEVVPVVILEHLWEVASKEGTRAATIACLEKTLKAAEAQKAVLISAMEPSALVRKRVLGHLARLKRSEEREQQIRRTQPPSRKPTSAKSFSDLLHKL